MELSNDKKHHGILSHPGDIHCIIFHLVTLFAYGFAFWLYLNPEKVHITGPWSRLAFISGASIMLGWISGIDLGVNFHNHTHRRIFRRGKDADKARRQTDEAMQAANSIRELVCAIGATARPKNKTKAVSK